MHDMIYKFRAYHKETNEMFHEDNPGDVFKWKNEGQPIVILQYTGCLDSEKKEIYLGDIVEDQSGCKYMVEWDQTEALFCLTDKYRDSCRFKGDSRDYKIIGNIFENEYLVW